MSLPQPQPQHVTHAWYYHYSNIVDWFKGCHQFDDSGSYQLIIEDCEKNKHYFTINRCEGRVDYVSLSEKKECLKGKFHSILAEKAIYEKKIEEHKKEIERLEEKFNLVSNILIDPNEKMTEDKVKELATELDSISQMIGRHKFEIKKIRDSTYSISYEKQIKEYIYYLPCATKCELMTMGEERTMNEKRYRCNVQLSWYPADSLKDLPTFCYVQMVSPSIIRTVETIQCTERIKLF